MYLIELFLPLYNNDKKPFEKTDFDRVRTELTQIFGGITAFQRAPAHGVWREDTGHVSHDEIIIFEVMVEQVDRSWWTRYRTDLQARFQQEQLVIRVTNIELL